MWPQGAGAKDGEGGKLLPQGVTEAATTCTQSAVTFCEALWNVSEPFTWEDHRGRRIYAHIDSQAMLDQGSSRVLPPLYCQVAHVRVFRGLGVSSAVASKKPEGRKQGADSADRSCTMQTCWSATGKSLHWLGGLSNGWCVLWGQRMLNRCPRGHWPLLISVTLRGWGRSHDPCGGYTYSRKLLMIASLGTSWTCPFSIIFLLVSWDYKYLPVFKRASMLSTSEPT